MAASLLNYRKIYLAYDESLVLTSFNDDFSVWINDHAVPETFIFSIKPYPVSTNNKKLVLNSTSLN